MKTVENGSSVRLHYKGTFPDGEVFDDSRMRGQMMEILVGKGQLIKGFESALIGMSEGETKTVNLTSDQAYGPPRPEMIVTAPRTAFPEDFKFEVGLRVQGKNQTGQPVLAKIVSFDAEGVTLDHNHPLAGKDINFEIEMVEIGDETKAANKASTLNEHTVKELRVFAKERGLSGYSRMNKSELIQALS